jgi:hypothetical protein
MHCNRSRSFVLCLRLASRLREWLIETLALPQAQEQHGELARHRDRRSLLGPRRPVGGHPESIGPQSALWAEGTKDILRCTDQEPTQVGVAAFGNAQLRIALPALVTPRT